jgi:hypothetical protein
MKGRTTRVPIVDYFYDMAYGPGQRPEYLTGGPRHDEFDSWTAKQKVYELKESQAWKTICQEAVAGKIKIYAFKYNTKNLASRAWYAPYPESNIRELIPSDFFLEDVLIGTRGVGKAGKPIL